MKSLRCRGSISGGKPQFGISRGGDRGRLGLWFFWGPEKKGIEAVRLLIRTECRDRRPVNFSYTFSPSIDQPCATSLEMSLEFKELIVGKDHSTEGAVYFETWLSDGSTLSTVHTLKDLLWLYRGNGVLPPKEVGAIQGCVFPDSAELAALSREALKPRSDTLRKEAEEKRLQAEEAKKKAEEAAKAAAASDKPAAAKGKTPTEPTLKPARCGIFYGSSTGNTEDIANRLKQELGSSVDYVRNITQIAPADLAACEVIILGVPTWHIGEMQDDWAVILPEVEKQNFSGKKIAVFGLGDGKGYPDTYVDAMQELLEKFEKSGAKLHGQWPTEGYIYQKSKAIRNGKFLGLVIDIENQNDQTDKRLKAWAQQLRGELAL